MTAPPPTVHAVVPEGIDDPARPSGGNRYDRRVLDELGALGWAVHEHRAGHLGPALAGIPDRAVVLVDGLLGIADPAAVVRASGRLRIVVLLHMPFAEAAADEAVRRAERTLLHAAASVVTTSAWARSWVVRHHDLPPDRVRVALPGVDVPGSRDGRCATSSTNGGRGGRPGDRHETPETTTHGGRGGRPGDRHETPETATNAGRGGRPGDRHETPETAPDGGRGGRPGDRHETPETTTDGGRGGRPGERHETSAGRRLLCLAAVTAGKGHDVLLAALAELGDLDWSCTCVGALDVEPEYAARLQRSAGDRIRFTGPLAGEALEDAFASADLLVSASRHEAYGMGVTEALARGVPALVTDVGGHPEAVGHVAGMLVPPDDPDTLAKELRRWLTDPAVRESLRTAAAQRRATLPSWTDTARALEGALR